MDLLIAICMFVKEVAEMIFQLVDYNNEKKYQCVFKQNIIRKGLKILLSKQLKAIMCCLC